MSDALIQTNGHAVSLPEETMRMVVEPLCKATKELLEPPRLKPTDRLYLWMDSEGRRFLADLRALERVDEGDAGAWFEHDGVTLGPRFTAPSRWADSTDGYPGVSREAMGFFNRLPERKALQEGRYDRRFRWRITATDFNVLVIHHCWPAEQVLFRPPGLDAEGRHEFPEDEEAKLLYRYLLTRFFAQGARARKVAAFKASPLEARVVPPTPDHWVESAERPLADYQRLIVDLGIGFDSVAVFADRGTGKTAPQVQAISHLARLKRMAGKGMLRAICVVPQQARKNWETEFERFATVPGKVTVIRGGLLERIRLLHRVVTSDPELAFSVAVISYDSAKNTIDHICRIPWDYACADESHKFKSSRTERWKTMERIRDASAIRVPMTGTPIGNTYMDLWTQLEFCGRGQSGFESFDAFRKFHGQWEQVGGVAHGVEKLTSMQNVPLLQERLARLTFAITKEEAGLKLPSKVYDFWEAEMTPRQADLYRRLSTELRVEIEDKLADSRNDSITVENILVQLLRLAQVTSGHVGFDAILDQETGETLRQRRAEQISWPNPKVEAVMEMLTAEDRDPRGKTIVWSCFVPDIKALHQRLDELGIEHITYYGGTPQKDREELEKRFNWDPTCRVMVCNPATAGEALNLVGFDWDNPDGPKQVTYTDHEIFFATNWSSLQRDQAEDRAHRRGMRAPQVRITDLVVPGTIDEEIRQRVRSKQEMAKLVLDIRAILKAVFTGDFAGGDEKDDE